MTAFVVLHSMFGAVQHRSGDVIEFSKDDEKGGIDTERLIALGAIRPASGDEAENSVKYGDSGEGALVPFPAVPYEPTRVSQGDEAVATAPQNDPSRQTGDTTYQEPKPVKK